MSIKEMLAQTGGKTAKFEAVGDTIAGPIVSTNVVQARDIKTGEPKVWDNGDPMQQIVVTVQSDSRDASDLEDDGIRSIYIKWWGLQRRALQDAVKAAGDDDIRVGGTFSATYVGDGEAAGRGMNAPKIYKYVYTPPSPTAGLLGQAAQQAAQPSPVQAVPTPAPAPAADPQAVMAQIKQLVAMGLTDQQITAAIPAVDAATVAAIRNLPAA